MFDKARCPICSNVLSSLKSHRDIRLSCRICFLWSMKTQGRGVNTVTYNRIGFVEIKNGYIADKHTSFVGMSEYFTITREARLLWERDEYKEFRYPSERGFPAFILYDLLGDWGLLRQQKAFESIVPILDEVKYGRGITWPCYVLAYEANA